MALIDVTGEVGGECVEICERMNGVYDILVDTIDPQHNDLVLNLEFDKTVYATIRCEGEEISLVGSNITFSGFRNVNTGKITV